MSAPAQRYIRTALATNDVAMLLYGLSAVLIGPTLPGMIQSFELTLGQGGFISAAQNAGGFAGAILSLWIADRISRPWTAVVSFVLLAVALFAVGLAPDYLALLAAFALTGFFIRTLDVALNAHTGTLAGARSGRAMSLLHMFFSVGAFTGPIVARAIMTAGVGWNDVYRAVGVGYLAVVLLGIGLLRRYVAARPNSAATSRPRAETGPAGGADIGAGQPRRAGAAVVLPILLLGGTLFFYAVHQVGLTSWVPYFLEHGRGAGADVAGLGLSAYWVGIIGGRFLASRLVERVGATRILVAGCVVSAAATLGAVSVPSVVAAEGLLVLAGVSSGATIPLAYAAGYAVAPAQAGRITAVMSVVMLVGRFAGPWAIGLVADATSLVPAMVIPGAALLVSAALSGGAMMLRSPAGNGAAPPPPS